MTHLKLLSLSFSVILIILFTLYGVNCHGHGHSHSHSHSHSHGHSHGQAANEKQQQQQQPETKLTGAELWFQAIGATLLISLAPYLLLFLIRVENTDKHKPLLHLLLSFASGGLLGDAFLHLIPHAIDPHQPNEEHGHTHSHSHGHSHNHTQHTQVGLWVVAGILTFLLSEKLLRSVGHSHGHSHSAKPSSPSAKSAAAAKKKKDDDAPDAAEVVEVQEVKLAGYLNLLADCMHNFTDGLAIGASFVLGRGVGAITTVTILFHEVPHEIGDYAILVQSGVPIWKARALQLLTACGALAGTIVALVCEGANPAYTAWILPFTAGGFIYIALVTVVPELLQPSSLWQTVKELIGFVTGVAMMVVIGMYE